MKYNLVSQKKSYLFLSGRMGFIFRFPVERALFWASAGLHVLAPVWPTTFRSRVEREDLPLARSRKKYRYCLKSIQVV